MYVILVSIALSMYSLILIDFSLLFHEISLNADSLGATQALYTAEGAIEHSFKASGLGQEAMRNISFLNERTISANAASQDYLEYNEGAQTLYLNRQMALSAPELKAADAYNPGNRVVKSGAYITAGATLDQKAIYGLEPSKSRQFTVREVDLNDLFNEIVFEYNQNSENSEVLFEVFAFPREGNPIDFSDFSQLKNGFASSVTRVVINTADPTLNGRVFSTRGSPLVVNLDGGGEYYKKAIHVSGFEPFNWNYILRYQTLDNQPVHFKLAAFNQNRAVMLPNVMQTIDIIGATTTGIYQRIKVQRQTEEGLQPGLNFAHFSNGPIYK